MTAINGQTGQNNADNLAKVRAAMAQAQQVESMEQVANQVQLGGALANEVLIDYTSPMGTHYMGKVVFKKPTAKDLMRIGGIKAAYFQEAGVTDLALVDSSVRLMAHILAHLKVVITKYPEWLLDLDGITDTDIIYEVYGEYRKWEDSFLIPIPRKQEGNSEASEGTKALDS